MIFRRADRYGPPNSIDKLKFIAILTMTIDHIGYFLFPDILWLRIIGRASFPIWLFIVGFHAAAQSTESEWQKMKRNLPLLLTGSALMLLSNLILSRPIFPISILLTILCVQALFSFQFIRNAIERQPFTVTVYALIALPTIALMEYGSIGLLFAMLGYLTRKGGHEEAIKINGFITIVCYAVVSNLTFAFTDLQEYLVIFVIFIMMLYLAQQRGIALWNLPVLHAPICFLARNSFYYYIAHLLLIKALSALFLPPESFGKPYFFLLK